MLLDISRSKGHETMKFGQLIEYNRKFFFVFENSCPKYGGETSLRPFFLENQN